MNTNCASLVADLFLFCYKTDFSFQKSSTYVFDLFNSTLRYLDDLLNIDNTYFE